MKKRQGSYRGRRGEGRSGKGGGKVAEGTRGGRRGETARLKQPSGTADENDSKTVEELRAELSLKNGENIAVRRLARFAVGE